MAEKKLRSEAPAVYVANESFYFGGNQLVMAGHTVVAGHPMLRGRMGLFRPFEATWPLPVKAATKPAAEPEPEPEPTTPEATEAEPEPEPA